MDSGTNAVKERAVRDFIAKEVPDWDDDVVSVARFKAFSGQRCDWQARFLFWRDLILKVATHFGLLFIPPSQVKNVWFNRGGLTPLCIDHVLSLMYNEGDIARTADLADPTSGRLTQLFRKVSNLMARSTPDIMSEEFVIVAALLKDKAAEIVKHLSESYWNSSCIITMKKFQDICGGLDEASAILSYMSGCGTAQYLSVHKKEFVEGVKISLSASALSGISNLDYDVLYLIWTTEKLQQQLDVIDRRYEFGVDNQDSKALGIFTAMLHQCRDVCSKKFSASQIDSIRSRKSALASLQSGNRKLALRYARELKLVTQSREKCSSLLNRVEEVLGIIVDAESTKKVSEAMQIGTKAIKANKISVEEVDLCLRDLQESIDSQKEVEKALEETPSYTDIGDEDIEEEFRKLELAIGKEAQVPAPEKVVTSAKGTAAGEATEFINEAFSNLRLSDDAAGKEGITQVVYEGDKKRSNLEMEAV